MKDVANTLLKLRKFQRNQKGDNMEDRYLFKAKRLDNGEWVIGNRIDSPDCRVAISETTGEWKLYECIPSTICQCTGLKDKNGKLIWENDIVGYYDKYGEKWCYGLVGYGEFNCSCCSGVYGWHFGDEDIREYQRYEVKGNKFDNPELLEVQA